ncbi:hypothetical protein ACLOJK_006263 [Asimina triloba]
MESGERDCSSESKTSGGDSFVGCRKKKMKNKRRFSDDQIKSLESMFEEETKLEPRKKVQLAKELGLQPRQVAIWFQNKRARWKSKQLEREYNELRASYDALASSFDSLKEEKRCLMKQLQKLRDMVEKDQEANRRCCSEPIKNDRHITDSDEGDASKLGDYEAKPSVLRNDGSDMRLSACSDREKLKDIGPLGLEEDREAEPLSLGEPPGSSLTLPESVVQQFAVVGFVAMRESYAIHDRVKSWKAVLGISHSRCPFSRKRYHKGEKNQGQM